MTDPVQWLDQLASNCEKTAQSSRKYGWRYHSASYTLMLLSLAGSIGAAVLAFWEGVDNKLIGIVALLPAISASVAGQPRMIEKGSWHFRRKYALERLARQFRLTAAQNPDWAAAEAANQTLAATNEQFNADWAEDLSFQFQGGGLGGSAKGE